MSNNEMLGRHRAVLPNWMALYYEEPISLVGGAGRHVIDSNGNKYLDFFAGILTNMTGYNVPELVEVIQDQAGKILHTSTVYMIESQIELAETIAARSGIPDAKVFFTNSGSEANDAALMLATAFRRSNQTLAMRHSYHGRTFSTVSMTGHSSWSPSSLSPFNVNYIHGSYPYRSPFEHMPDDQYIEACTDDLRNILEIATAGDVACLLAEPILGVGGFGVPPDGLFGSFKQVLDERGILFISDEVQTGWGRTGEHYWGYEAHGMTPDILTFAKGLGNGLALGGVVARAEIMDCWNASSLSTFGGNPLSTRGALANLAYHDKHGLQANCTASGVVLRKALDGFKDEFAAIGEVRGKGLMLGIELVEPGTKTPDAALASKMMEGAKARGLLIGKGGTFGNVIRMAPPMTLTLEEAAEGAGILHETLRAVTEKTRTGE